MALHDVYALSETCAPVTVLDDALGRAHLGSVGRAAPYVELRVVDEGGTDVGTGEPGELWVRSAATTPGYWGREQAPVSEEGWLRTGDLVRLDAEGLLRVGGRAVDLVIRGGVNVYPGEVERALLATGLLSDAAVVGLPSPVLGQAVAAGVVLLDPDADRDEVRAVLRRAVRDALGVHAVPRPLRVLDVIPRNPHGKVDRTALAAMLTDEAARPTVEDGAAG